MSANMHGAKLQIQSLKYMHSYFFLAGQHWPVQLLKLLVAGTMEKKGTCIYRDREWQSLRCNESLKVTASPLARFNFRPCRPPLCSALPLPSTATLLQAISHVTHTPAPPPSSLPDLVRIPAAWPCMYPHVDCILLPAASRARSRHPPCTRTTTRRNMMASCRPFRGWRVGSRRRRGRTCCSPALTSPSAAGSSRGPACGMLTILEHHRMP